MQNVVRRPNPILSQSPARLFQALRAASIAGLRHYLPLIQLALVYIRHGRYEMERAEQPSGMAKATLIVLGGLAILAVALFAALRASAGKISTQMNADY